MSEENKQNPEQSENPESIRSSDLIPPVTTQNPAVSEKDPLKPPAASDSSPSSNTPPSAEKKDEAAGTETPSEKDNTKKKPKKKRSLFRKILNFFLGIVLFVLVLILLLFGFMQTATFRNWMRDKIVDIANEELNGTVSIERIDGTIFTSLIINGAALDYGSDRIASIPKLEILISPHRLLVKEILIRSVLLEDASIKLLRDSSGTLNIAKVFPPSKDTVDSVSSPFPFAIIIEALSVSNLSFSMQNENLAASDSFYTTMDMSDLRIRNMNLSLAANIDLAKKYLHLALNNFSFEPNFSNVRQGIALKGDITVEGNEVRIQDFNLKTENTDLSFDVSANGFNPLDSIPGDLLKRMKVSLDLRTEKLHFHDLASFVPGISFLDGEVIPNIKASGSLNDMTVEKLTVDYRDTFIDINGSVKNIDNAKNLFIDVSLSKSTITQRDVTSLMPDFSIPLYDSLGTVYFDTLTFKGEPLDFSSLITLRIGNSSFSGTCDLNLKNGGFVYDLKAKAENFDLRPIIQTPLTVTFNNLEAKGSGLNPETMQASLVLNAGKTVLGSKTFDEITFNASASRGLIDITASSAIGNQNVRLDANVTMAAGKLPAYTFALDFNYINAAMLFSNPKYESDLSGTIRGSGEAFNPEQLRAQLRIDLLNSSFREERLQNLFAELSLETPGSAEKNIRLNSNLIDLSLTGTFEFADLAAVFSRELDSVSSSIYTKVNSYFPFMEETPVASGSFSFQSTLPGSKEPPVLKVREIDIKYSAAFKDLKVLRSLLGGNQLYIQGTLFGSIKNDSSGFVFSIGTEIANATFGKPDSLFNVQNAYISLDVFHKRLKYDFADINVTLYARVEKFLLAGYEDYAVSKLAIDGNISDSKLLLQAHSLVNGNIEGGVSFSTDFPKDTLIITVDTMSLRYNNMVLHEKNDFTIYLQDNALFINGMNLEQGNSALSVNGFITETGNQSLTISASRFHLGELYYYLTGTPPTNFLQSDLSLDADVGGTFTDPVIRFNFTADSISYQNNNFGHLSVSAVYQNKIIEPNVRVFGPRSYREKPLLQLTGNIPIDLSFTPVPVRYPLQDSIRLKLISNNFDLSVFGDFLPQINNLKGFLVSDVTVSGVYPDINWRGTFSVRNASFVLEANNMTYGAGVTVQLSRSFLLFDSLYVTNLDDLKHKGTIRGSGRVDLDSSAINKASLVLNGSLAVLRPESKQTNPQVFGDLLLGTDGDIIFMYNRSDGRMMLTANVLVKYANLTFQPAQSAYTASSETFRYLIKNERVKQVIVQGASKGLLALRTTSKETRFDYDIGIKFVDNATLTFILSKEANQKLTAVLGGQLTYQVRNNKEQVQGELELLEDSKLELMNLKTFIATGKIKFLKNIANPFLDIVAMYRSYYTFNENTASQRDEEVAVKIKLRGTLNELLEKNFADNDQNIAVYVGTDQIIDDKPSTDYTKRDALWFILTGKLASDLTNADKTTAAGQVNALQGTATSLAGSLLGGLLNAYLGDFVKSIEVRTVGTNTKFNLAGRFKDLRYSFGGSTDVFQDFSAANFRIEYPIFDNLWLRLERYPATDDLFLQSEMVSEVGLKYRFRF